MQNKKIICLGEIMLRLSPADKQRFTQAKSFEINFGGSEANVAVSLANFGLQSGLVTTLPENEIANACINYLKSFSVDTSYIIKSGERIGIYFLEKGSMLRPSKVIYDRNYSAFSKIKKGAINWGRIFKNACWFHFSGINPAISKNVYEVLLEGCKVAKKNKIKISCDINYRKNLWKWTKNPAKIMEELVKFADIIIANEEDAEKVFGIKAPDTEVEKGKINIDKYNFVAKKLEEKFNNLQLIAITLRTSISADHNKWTACLWQNGNFFKGIEFNLTHIVDRVGAGDSFAAGLIYGFLNFKNDPQKILNFAIGASALKHTIAGDFNLITLKEVESLMQGNVSGRVVR